MVQDAPSFAEVAPELYSYLDGAVLAAHNARFDHGFLKNEYKRMGATLRQKVMCTVKLSRQLYPQHPSHSLDAIIERHDLTGFARHRAMGDVEVLLAYFQAAMHELGADRVKQVADQLIKGPTLPATLNATLPDELPDGPGVYFFYGENDLPLYIGKSVNLRARVLSHFSGDHALTKDLRIAQQIKRVDWIETAGELGALLLESRLIKERQPIHNRRLRRSRRLCSWRIAPMFDTVPLLTLVRECDIDPASMYLMFGAYRSKTQAVQALRSLAEQYGLCLKVLGLERGSGPCFVYQLRRCKGVCVHEEAPEIHYLRVQQALAAQRLKSWPFADKIAIREQHAATERTQLHVFDHWLYLGTVESETELHDLRQERRNITFDLDTYRLLLGALAKEQTQVITLSGTVRKPDI